MPASKNGGKANKSTSLKKQREAVDAKLHVKRKSERGFKPSKAAIEAKLTEKFIEENMETMEFEPTDDLNDETYYQNVPGRPAQPRGLFDIVYGHAAFDKAIGMYVVACGEPRCRSTMLIMNAKWQEMNSKSTPHSKPRRPPVCHQVPWAALELQMLNDEDKQGKKYSAAFRQAVCWYPGNLVPGHNACNAAGVKTTAQSATDEERRQAKHVIETVRLAYVGSIWA